MAPPRCADRMAFAKRVRSCGLRKAWEIVSAWNGVLSSLDTAMGDAPLCGAEKSVYFMRMMDSMDRAFAEATKGGNFVAIRLKTD